MGSDFRFGYSALGDPVNLASRLESETKNHDVAILLGEETARLVADHFSTAELARVTVKGKSEICAVSTVVETPPATLETHREMLADLYGGRLGTGDPRLQSLPRAIPSLAGYYNGIRLRLASTVH